MTDLIFQIGLSNVLVSLALAVTALVVGAVTRRPHPVHLLWLLVLVKLMTPPVVTIPVVTVPVQPAGTVVSMEEHSQPNVPLINNSAETLFAVLDHRKKELSLIWLLGSVFVFTLSLARVYRFNSLLREESEVAPQELQTLAARIANQLSLKRVPTIYTTSAYLSPMVWWIGGKVKVVIPSALRDRMDTRQFQWILAHELAHVRRRDYLVRWIEWLACVCFWWNPVVWLARNNLRASEDLCCDALVVSRLQLKPKTYAQTLIKAVEYLARPVIRPPAMASEINSGGFLERRFKMIVSEKLYRRNSRWMQAIVLLCALVVLPLGVVFGQDYEAVGKRLRAAVQAGELSGEQAWVMLDALLQLTDRDESRVDLRARFDAAAEQIRSAIAAGEITEEQGRARLEEMRQMLAEQTERQDPDAERRVITREEYARAEAEIRQMVAEGRVSEEDARIRLGRMRRMLAEQTESQDPEAESRGITREEYARAEAEIRQMVAEGRVSEEDARIRLGEMRRMITEQSESQDTDAVFRAIEARIRAAVEAGTITREEAGKLLEDLRKLFGR